VPCLLSGELLEARLNLASCGDLVWRLGGLTPGYRLSLFSPLSTSFPCRPCSFAAARGLRKPGLQRTYFEMLLLVLQCCLSERCLHWAPASFSCRVVWSVIAGGQMLLHSTYTDNYQVVVQMRVTSHLPKSIVFVC